MGMSYPVSYRPQSQTYGTPAGNGLSNLPAPYKPPTSPAAVFPSAANDNFSRFGASNTARALSFALKFTRFARLNPWFNAAITAYDLYNLINKWSATGMQSRPNPGAWASQGACADNTGRPPPNPLGKYTSNGFIGLNCVLNAGQATGGPPGAPGGPAYLGAPVGPNVNSFTVERAYYLDFLGAWRTDQKEVFWRVSGSPVNAPYPYTFPTEVPPYIPSIVQPPPNTVVPWPLPPPFIGGTVDPRVDHTDTRDVGNDPITPNDPTKLPPNVGIRQPPPPGTRERKVKVIQGLVLQVQRLAHAGTEFADAVEAIHDALPAELKAKPFYDKHWGWRKPTITAQANAIYKNFDKVDLDAAVKNLVVNHVTDEVVGRISGRAGDWGNRNRVRFGNALG